MPLLESHKWEMFANLIAQGTSPQNAYTSVGYSAKGVAKSASRLYRSPRVFERVTEIRANIARLAAEKSSRNYLRDNEKRIEAATRRHEIISQEIDSAPVFDKDRWSEARKLEEHVANLLGEWAPDGSHNGLKVLVVIPASLIPAEPKQLADDDAVTIDLLP